MAITMQDIQNEGFEHSLRGYDVEQVDIFLERVANEVDVMNNRISELEGQVKAKETEIYNLRERLDAFVAEETEEAEQTSLHDQEVLAELKVANERAEAESKRAEEAEERVVQLQEQLEEKNKLDSAISEAFIAAQRSADQIKEDARAEADRIYHESESKAREFIRESLESKAALDNEIQSLQASAQRFRSEYLDMLERFMSEAKDEFSSLSGITVSEDQVESQLPDAETLQASEAEVAEQVEDDDLPRLTTDQIPHIDIPEIFPETEE